MNMLAEYHRKIANAQGRQTAAKYIRAAATAYVGETAHACYPADACVAIITDAERHAQQLEQSTVTRPIWRQWLRDWGYATAGPND